jgi:NADH-quinone oxidoreductase subunit E
MPQDSQADPPVTGVPDASSLDLSPIAEVLEEYDPAGNLITVLQRVQERFGYLPEPVVNEVARQSGIPASRIYGIITFYAQFTTEPSGRHKIFVCHGTACHVAGAEQITEELRRHLGIPPDADTDPRRLFTLDAVACIGCCSLAPVMMIEEETAGRLTPAGARQAIDAVAGRT